MYLQSIKFLVALDTLFGQLKDFLSTCYTKLENAWLWNLNFVRLSELTVNNLTYRPSSW